MLAAAAGAPARRDDPYLVVAADKGTATFSDIANAICGRISASGSAMHSLPAARPATTTRRWASPRAAAGNASSATSASSAATSSASPSRSRASATCPATYSATACCSRRTSGWWRRSIISTSSSIRTPTPARSYARARSGCSGCRARAGTTTIARRSRAAAAIYERSAKSIAAVARKRRRCSICRSGARRRSKSSARSCACGSICSGTAASAPTSRPASERHGEIGDRANDAVRVDGRRCARASSARAAISASRSAAASSTPRSGGRLNADFIDNSAGVNTSDVEVNLKILLDAPGAGVPIARARRNRLLAAATDEVAELVLRNNYLQSQAISLMEQRARADLGEHQRLLRWLERHGELDRAVEFLPDDEEIEERRRAGPRTDAARTRAAARVRQDRAQPRAHRQRQRRRSLPGARAASATSRWRSGAAFAERIKHHRLRTQIIITATTNSIVNRVGPALLMQCCAGRRCRCGRTSPAPTPSRATAPTCARCWAEIEALDGAHQGRRAVPAPCSTDGRLPAPPDAVAAARTGANTPRSARRWRGCSRLLREFAQVIASGARGTRSRALSAAAPAPARAWAFRQRLAETSRALEPLQVAPDLIAAHGAHAGSSARAVAHAHFGLSGRLGLDWLHGAIEQLPASGDWQQRGQARLQSAALAAHLRLSAAALSSARGATRAPPSAAARSRRRRCERWQQRTARSARAARRRTWRPLRSRSRRSKLWPRRRRRSASADRCIGHCAREGAAVAGNLCWCATARASGTSRICSPAGSTSI